MPHVGWLEAFGVRKHFISAESVEEVYGKWEKPDEDEAKKRYMHSHMHHETFDVKAAHVGDLKEFGQGHMLYFYFLKYMACLFAFLALLPATAQITVNLAGGYFAVFSDLDRTSLGNYGLQSSNNNSAELNVSLPSTNKGADAEITILKLFLSDGANSPVRMDSTDFDKRNTIVAISVLDLIGTCVYFGFTIFLIIYTRSLAQKVDDNTTTIHDYAVRVEGVPLDTEVGEVQKYFEQWGEVMMVEPARKLDDLMDLVVERGKVVEELDDALALLQRTASVYPKVNEELETEVLNLRYDLALLGEAIRAKQAEQGGADTVEMYVTYQDDRGKVACLAAQPQSFWRRFMMEPEKRFRGKHVLRITSAPEPTDIKYENLEFKWAARTARQTLTLATKLFIVVVGFVLVSLAPAAKRNIGAYAQLPALSTCDDSCNWRDKASGALKLPDDLRDTYKNCYTTGVYDSGLSCEGATVCYECYCKYAYAQSMYTEMSYCSEFNQLLALQVGSQVLTVVGILVVNLVVALLINALTLMERHHVRSREARSKTRALFYTQFLNTAISTVLANTYFPRLQEKLAGSWAEKILFGGIYADLTPNWYRDVGKPLVLSHMLGIPIRCGTILMRVLMRRWRLRRRYKALNQAQLDGAYEGHEFELAVRYGEHLTVIFVALLFSSGMPLMLWSAALSFTAHYWLEKYELLRVCKWPSSMSSDLAVYVATTLPFATLWHLAGGAWAYSLIGVNASPLAGGSIRGALYGLVSALGFIWPNTTGLTADEVADRLAQNDSMHLVYFFFIFAISLFVFLSLREWIKVMQQLGTLLGLKKPPDAEALAPAHGVPEFTIALRSQLLVGPASYDVQKNPNYSHVFVRMEDLQLDEELLRRVEERRQRREAGAAGKLGALLDGAALRRRMRRDKARKALRNKNGGGAGAGFSGDEDEGADDSKGKRRRRRGRSGSKDADQKQQMTPSGAEPPSPFKKGSFLGNAKVAPEPFPGMGAVTGGGDGGGNGNSPDDVLPFGKAVAVEAPADNGGGESHGHRHHRGSHSKHKGDANGNGGQDPVPAVAVAAPVDGAYSGHPNTVHANRRASGADVIRAHGTRAAAELGPDAAAAGNGVPGSWGASPY